MNDTSPAPATVTDEERRALLKKALSEAMIGSRGGLTWEGGYARGWDDFKASVGPALARLAELKLTVSQLRCEVSAYRADLRELLPIKARLIEAIENAEAGVCDIVAPQDLREILTGSDTEKGKT